MCSAAEQWRSCSRKATCAPLGADAEEKLAYELRSPGPNRLLFVADAFRAGWSLARIQELIGNQQRGGQHQAFIADLAVFFHQGLDAPLDVCGELLEPLLLAVTAIEAIEAPINIDRDLAHRLHRHALDRSSAFFEDVMQRVYDPINAVDRLRAALLKA